jgi:hypothetical protein
MLKGWWQNECVSSLLKSKNCFRIILANVSDSYKSGPNRSENLVILSILSCESPSWAWPSPGTPSSVSRAASRGSPAERWRDSLSPQRWLFSGWSCIPTCSVNVVDLCLFLFYYSGDVWPDFILYTGGLASLLVFLLFYESFLAKFLAVSECHVSYFACSFLCHCGAGVGLSCALLLVCVYPILSYCWWACALSRVIVGGHVPCLALLLMWRTCLHAS